MYYIEENNKIVLFDESKSRLVDTIAFMPQYQELEILETDKEIVTFDGEFYFVDDEEYIAKKEQAERERIQALSMTRSDFFDGMIMAFGLGQAELRVVIENILNSINITDVEIKVALNNFDNALNFYRKHTLFSLLSGIDIPITEEKTINIASTQWDKFFDETSKQNPDAYKFLIK
jgi:hypothetical protein